MQSSQAVRARPQRTLNLWTCNQAEAAADAGAATTGMLEEPGITAVCAVCAGEEGESHLR